MNFTIKTDDELFELVCFVLNNIPPHNMPLNIDDYAAKVMQKYIRWKESEQK